MSDWIDHSIDAEQSILGGLLFNNAAFPVVEKIIKPEHFFEPIHKSTYEVISQLISAGKLCNAVTIRSFLPANLSLGELNLGQYIARLAAVGADTINLREYCHSVRDLADLRALRLIANDILQSTNPDPSELGSLAVDAVDSVLSARAIQDSPSLSIGASVARAIDAAALAYQSESAVVGMSYGLRALDAKTGGLHKGELTLLAGRPGMMKAQPLSSKIRTPNGWITMGGVKIGDEVESIDGEKSIVTGVFPQGAKQVFKIVFSDGRATRACADHLWRVFYRDWDAPRIISTSEIIKMLDRKRYRRRLWVEMPLPRKEQKSSSNLPIDPWVLGALIGDGNFTKNRLRFTSASQETISRLRERIPDVMKLVEEKGSPYSWCINMKKREGGKTSELRDALRGLGLYGLKSYQKFIPADFLNASYADRLSLLNGLLDTDGSVQKNSTIRYWTSSEILAENVQELARSLGAWCSCASYQPSYPYLGKKKLGRTAYRLTICHPFPRELFRLSAKRERSYEFQAARKMPVIERVSEDGYEDCQCISVSHPTHLYLTDDYVVTHNTGVALNFTRELCAEKVHRATGEIIKPAYKGIFYSFEMGDILLTQRLLSDMIFMEGREVHYSRIRKGSIDETDFEFIISSAEKLEKLPLLIEQQGGMNLAQVGSKARRQKLKHGLDFIVVDYLQLMGVADRYRGNRVSEVSELSTGLLKLAKDLDIAVLALSQLNRGVESRDDKRPQLSDLRESGSLEQDASVVMMLYRPLYYLQNKEPRPGTPEFETWAREMETCLHKLDIGVEKNRNGPSGSVEVYVNPGVNAVRDQVQDNHLPYRI